MSRDYVKENDKLTVSQMSKLRNIPINTLKHYDRIGLLKPHFVNQENNYRYYSITQYDIIGLIVELRQLGLPLKEIEKYIKKRNVLNSLEVLELQDKELDVTLKELNELSEIIKQKISTIKKVTAPTYNLEDIVEKEFPRRKIATFDRDVQNDIEGSCAALELEQILKEKAPSFAGDMLGVLIPKEELELKTLNKTYITFIFLNRTSDVNELNSGDDRGLKIIEIPKGKFISSQYHGNLWERANCLNNILEYIDKKDYKIKGEALQLNVIDEIVTEDEKEFIFEIQVPVY